MLSIPSFADVPLQVATITAQEKQEILSSDVSYVYFGDLSQIAMTTPVIPFTTLVAQIAKISQAKEISAELNDIIARIATNTFVAPLDTVLTALNNLHECLIWHNDLIADDKELRSFDTAITTYRKLFLDGTLSITNTPIQKPHPVTVINKPKESVNPGTVDNTVQKLKGIKAQIEALIASLEMRIN